VNTPVSLNASESTILAPQTSSVVQSVPELSHSLPVSEIRIKLMASLGLDSFALTAYFSNLHRESCTSYLLNDWDHQAFGPLSLKGARRVSTVCCIAAYHNVDVWRTFFGPRNGCSPTKELHPIHVRMVPETFKHHRLYAKLAASKCQLGRTSIAFLCYVISKRGVAMDSRKVADIRDWARPTPCTEVRRFGGLANYYRRFVRQLSSLVAPLTSLYSPLATFRWSDTSSPPGVGPGSPDPTHD
jgi:hypothetical protein